MTAHVEFLFHLTLDEIVTWVLNPYFYRDFKNFGEIHSGLNHSNEKSLQND